MMMLQADHVVVLKNERRLELFSQGELIKTYKVALGRDPIGPKTRQGDHKTPEGFYILDSRNPHSKFHKSLHISYPSARDSWNLASSFSVRPSLFAYCQTVIELWTGPTRFHVEFSR